jgi:hypothetical protein
MLQKKRSVQFRSIEILEFAYIVGDNPSVSSGVPLSMEWTPQAKTVLPLCFFETHRPPPRTSECGPRRISSRRREKILLRNGCSIQDMASAARDVLIIQKERASTKHQLKQTRKVIHYRRQRDVHQEPAEVTAPVLSSPSVGIIMKKPMMSTDRSPIMPQRRSFLLTPSSTPTTTTAIDSSSYPTTVSKEKLSSRLSTAMLHRPCLTGMIAQSAYYQAKSAKPATHVDWIKKASETYTLLEEVALILN